MSEGHDAPLAGLDPEDVHDRRLLETLRPAGWRNPAPLPRYDLVVLGGGTAGLVAAAGAAGLGARVALVEQRLMGGDCLNFGCVPSKALLASARSVADARRAAESGLVLVTGEPDFAAVMERLRRVRAELAPHDGPRRFQALGVHVFLGRGAFASRDRVEVDGVALCFRRALIATGAAPALPPVPGLAEARPFTSETLFGLRELPPRLVVLGGGPQGCELAQAFARLGSRVSLLERGERLLSRDEPSAAALVTAALRRDGVELLADVEVMRVERRGAVSEIVVRRGGAEERRTADALLVAAGRAPRVAGLGLEAAGVRAGPAGVAVDEHLVTTNPAILAAGDVVGGVCATHVADAQARIALRNALFPGRASVRRLLVPHCTFTDPELAQVGPTEAEARDAGLDVRVLTLDLATLDRALLDGEGEGLYQLVLAARGDRILGATIVARHAGELLAPISQAILGRRGLARAGAAIAPYPTLSAALGRLADEHARRRLTPRVRRLLAAWFRLRR